MVGAFLCLAMGTRPVVPRAPNKKKFEEEQAGLNALIRDKEIEQVGLPYSLCWFFVCLERHEWDID